MSAADGRGLQPMRIIIDEAAQITVPLTRRRAIFAGTTRKVLTIGRFLGPEHVPLNGAFHYPRQALADTRALTPRAPE